MTIWQVLDLAPDAERDAIRRAYAKKLRVTQPEDDPEGFKVLREAYEQALAQADWRATWAQEDEEDANEDGDVWREIEATPPAREWSAVPAPAAPDAAPEFAALLVTREADLVTLREWMAALEAGLRGPWRASDAELDERLRAILDAEAMGELGIRDDVEPWLAELIADTIPASDAILREAIEAFGWDDGAVRHYAVHGVLRRLDEWRMIASLNHAGHDYHDGWRSLTGPPGNAFFWRIDAFRPGLRRGAAALLGHFGEVSPGLKYSFNAASVERWEAYFAGARLTIGTLCQIPALFALLLSALYAISGAAPPVPLILLCAVLACAAPFVTLMLLAPWRRSWAMRDHTRWEERGWVAAYAISLLLVGLLPGLWPLLLLPHALRTAIWAFLAKSDSRPDTGGFGLAIAVWVAAALMTLPLLSELSAAQSTALGTAALLFVYLRVWHRRDAGAILDDLLGEHREWWLLGMVVGAAALGVGITALHGRWESVSSFYPVALCLLAAALPLGVVAPGGGPPRWIARVAMTLAFLAAGIATLPPEAPPKPYVAGGEVPLADGGTADRSDDDLLFDSGTARRALTALERAQPGFAGVRTGDPVLYAELRAELEKFYDGQATRAEAAAAFSARIDTAYRAKLPDADAGTLMETQRIRVSVLRALRKVDVAACADEGIKAYDPALLTQGQRNRQNAQIYNVIGNPSVPAAAQRDATPVSADTLLARTATALDMDKAAVSAAIAGKRGAEARCDARIAMLETLVELPQPGVVAMLRREMRRQRTK